MESPPAHNPPPVARQLLLLLLSTFGRELPDIGSYQEVHHRLIALLHGEQLRDLHVSASARSPSRCFPHLGNKSLEARQCYGGQLKQYTVTASQDRPRL